MLWIGILQRIINGYHLIHSIGTDQYKDHGAKIFPNGMICASQIAEK